VSTSRRPITPERSARIFVALLALPLALAACGAGGATQVGAAPTRDWPSEMTCPPTLLAVCADKRLTLFSTINEPAGTTYGVASSNEDIFVICHWPAGAANTTCQEIPATGARVIGEAAVYRAEG
jgi:hypothetical protein